MTSISATNALRFQGSVFLKNEGQMAPDLRAAVKGRFNQKVHDKTKPDVHVVFYTTITGSDESNNLSDTVEVYRWNKATQEKEGLFSIAWLEPTGLLALIPGARAISRTRFLSQVLSYAKKLNDPNFPPKPDQPDDEPQETLPPGLEGVLKLPAPGTKERPLAVNKHVVRGDADAAVTLRFPTAT